ncbi:hypothetical protein HKD37_18G051030 [Glycine soja]
MLIGIKHLIFLDVKNHKPEGQEAVAGLTQHNNAKPVVDSSFSKAKPEHSLDSQFKPPEASQLVSIFTILFLGKHTQLNFFAFDVHPNPIISKRDTLLFCYCLFTHFGVLQMKMYVSTIFRAMLVLDFLRAKGASKDPTRVIAKVVQSEYKRVYDYLADTTASVQTRESINEFLTSVKQHDLAKVEVLNILNIGPAADFELYPVIIKILIFPFMLHLSI